MASGDKLGSFGSFRTFSCRPWIWFRLLRPEVGEHTLRGETERRGRGGGRGRGRRTGRERRKREREGGGREGEAGGVAFARLRGPSTALQARPSPAPMHAHALQAHPNCAPTHIHALRARPSPAPMHAHALQACPSHGSVHTYAFSMSCSSSWTLRLSSSAGGKPLPTFMKSAAILLLRRKPAALRRSPCSTQASTAAVETQWSVAVLSLVQSPAPTVQRKETAPVRQRSQEASG